MDIVDPHSVTVDVRPWEFGALSLCKGMHPIVSKRIRSSRSRSRCTNRFFDLFKCRVPGKTLLHCTCSPLVGLQVFVGYRGVTLFEETNTKISTNTIA